MESPATELRNPHNSKILDYSLFHTSSVIYRPIIILGLVDSIYYEILYCLYTVISKFEISVFEISVQLVH